MLRDTEAAHRTYGDDFILTLFTDDPATAAAAANAGVDRIGPDLECIGKEKRQYGMNSRVSAHSPASIESVAKAVDGRAGVCVRVNPINPRSKEEIEMALSGGATHLMLPFFHKVAEAEEFAALAGARARKVLLVETAASAFYIDALVALAGVDEIYFGLNDMRISLKIENSMSLMTSWFLEALVAKVQASGKPCHVAGVARPGDVSLPVPSDLVLAQYPRLGADGALVSRSFMNTLASLDEMPNALRELREALTRYSRFDELQLQRSKSELARYLNAPF